MATRRDELAAVAARLFAERGYHGTSMADLADAMGVQKGSLYSLTGSKQDLLVVVTREGAAAFHAALDPVADDADPLERIRAALRGHLAVVAAQPRSRLDPDALSHATTLAAFLLQAGDTPGRRADDNE